eukprot:tig00000147_g9463.t1
MEAKLRAIDASSAAPPERESISALWIDLRRLCRLRRVCRRLAELVESGGAAPRARLELQLSSDSFESSGSAHEQLDRVCAGAARVGGIEELDLNLWAAGNQDQNLPAFSLAPLARLRSLRALRVGSEVRPLWFYGTLAPEHVAALTDLPRLARLDFRGDATSIRDLSNGFSLSPAALAALSPLPLAALRANVLLDESSEGSSVDSSEGGEIDDGGVGDGGKAARELLRALSGVAAAFPALQRLLLYGDFYCGLDDFLAALAPLKSLQTLELCSTQYCGLSSLAPLASFPRLEHLALDMFLSDGIDLRPISSLTSLRSLDLGPGSSELTGDVSGGNLSVLEPLTRLEAVRLHIGLNGSTFDPSRLLFLAPRIRCLHFSAVRMTVALIDALLRFPALQDITLGLRESECSEALSGRSLSPWGSVRALAFSNSGVRACIPLSAAVLSGIAYDMTGLRELSVGGGVQLPLPLPAGAGAALRGRLRRLRARVVDEKADAATQSEQRALQAELERAVGVRVEAPKGFR